MKWQSENRKWAELVSVCSTRPWVKTCLGLYSTSPTPPTPWKCTGTSEEAALWCSALHEDDEDCEEGMLAFRLAFLTSERNVTILEKGLEKPGVLVWCVEGPPNASHLELTTTKLLSDAFFDINVNTRTTLGSLVHIGQNLQSSQKWWATGRAGVVSQVPTQEHHAMGPPQNAEVVPDTEVVYPWIIFWYQEKMIPFWRKKNTYNLGSKNVSKL